MRECPIDDGSRPDRRCRQRRAARGRAARRRSSSSPGGRSMQWSIDALRRVPAIERDRARAAARVPAPPRASTARRAGAPCARSRCAWRWRRPADRRDPVLVHDAARPLLSGRARRAGAGGAARAIPTPTRRSPPRPVTRHDQARRRRRRRARDARPQRACGRSRRPRCSAARRSNGRSTSPDEELARATDDAWLIERARGQRGRSCAADEQNLKVTTARSTCGWPSCCWPSARPDPPILIESRHRMLTD